jgi:uncharacterized membrane-anchored protein
LGFGGGALVIGSAIAVIVLLHYFTRISGVLLFWAAFVLTRPFGATFGDLLTKSRDKGGLGIGTVGSSAVLAVILIVLVWRARRAHLDVVPAVDPLAPEAERTRQAIKRPA